MTAHAAGAAATGPVGTEAGPEHHIATNKNSDSDVRGGPWTPRFERIFERAGMTLEDPANKVRVPGHQGPHPEQYHREVYRRLSNVTLRCDSVRLCADALVRELQKLARELTTPGSDLNKLVTRAE